LLHDGLEVVASGLEFSSKDVALSDAQKCVESHAGVPLKQAEDSGNGNTDRQIIELVNDFATLSKETPCHFEVPEEHELVEVVCEKILDGQI